MIARVRGRLLEKHPTRVVVEVGGLGLELHVPFSTSQSLGAEGQEATLFTVLVVREDALTLYGFHGADQRGLFLKLIGVSGIGPKIALNALSGPTPTELVAAIRDRDLAVLTRLPGIGKKTAERLSLELKDGLADFAGAAAAPAAGGDEDAVLALISLGYTRPSALEAARRAREELGSDAGAEALIRTALARLSGAKGR